SQGSVLAHATQWTPIPMACIRSSFGRRTLSRLTRSTSTPRRSSLRATAMSETYFTTTTESLAHTRGYTSSTGLDVSTRATSTSTSLPSSDEQSLTVAPQLLSLHYAGPCSP